MSDCSVSRRQLLSGSLAVMLAATAGCAESRADDSSSKEALSLVLSSEEGSLRDRFVVDLSKTRPEWDEEAFRATLDGVSYTTQARRPFLSTPENPKYAEDNETYYRLESVVVNEVTAVRPVLRLTEVKESGESTPSGVPVGRLPTPDQGAVRVAHLAARARGDTGGVPWGLVQRGGAVYRDEQAIEASALLADDGPSHVRYREETYRVSVARERFHEPVYRAIVEPITDDPEQLEAALRAQFVTAHITQDDISTAARDVLLAAQHDGYSEPHPYSKAYREVLRQLHERAYIDGDIQNDAGVDDGGRRMLYYEDTYYDYQLRFGNSEDA